MAVREVRRLAGRAALWTVWEVTGPARMGSMTEPPSGRDAGSPERDARGTRRGRRPSPGAKAVRERRAEDRSRKERESRALRVAGVLASYGIDTPEQADGLMRRLLDEERLMADDERTGWRRFLLGTLKARITDRWPERPRF